MPADDNQRDAQPHWHVYRTMQDKEIPAFDVTDLGVFEPSPSEEVRDFGEEIVPSLMETDRPKDKTALTDKFHFAMASSWHLNDEYQIRFETPQSLVDWLSRCVKYIRGQLNYLADREGTA